MISGQPNQLVGPRSVNLFITNLCNRACPFCYLNDWVTNDKKTAIHMSLNNLDTLIHWLKNSKIDRVKIAGGEPMLHPEIISIVTKLVKNGVALRMNILRPEVWPILLLEDGNYMTQPNGKIY